MDIQVPSVPRHLRITHTMWEDFLCDPVLAAWVIFGVRLDAFQSARLRYLWWVQNVIESSGVGGGKTIADFIFSNLRCILLTDQDAAVIYPSFGTGKNSFWIYYSDFAMSDRAKIFRAQLGNPVKTDPGEEIDGDGTLHGPDCFTAFFRNGNWLKMPAPSIMMDSVRLASLTVNTLIIEEWTHIDNSSDAIDKQLIDRSRGASWNQFHPIWGNHIVLSAHAQTRRKPCAIRYRNHERRVQAGDPTYANLSYSYKDFSDLRCHTGESFKRRFRVESAIQNKRNTCEKAEWMGQGFGIWGVSGEGWFTEQAILQAIENGKQRGLLPALSRVQYEEMMAKAV